MISLRINIDDSAPRAALAALSPSDLAAVKRQADTLIVALQARKAHAPTRLGNAGALELLAALGRWMNEHPHLVRRQLGRRYDPDDLLPETKR
jgi:hypothetical protein